ncbi:helix-turn-helix transcriptional regulator [Streptomyces sp. NPDC089799]|uniref:response regulator transcription factor n=1 Tax=Streptomyces sp. NPDC089799 TaxID=3155066 RepID=UPI00343E1DBB
MYETDLTHTFPAAARPVEPAAGLTPREEEVLAHLAQGDTYRMIAYRLGLSPHTVDTYLRRLRSKTGAVNRTQLTHVAFRLGYGPSAGDVVVPNPRIRRSGEHSSTSGAADSAVARIHRAPRTPYN